MPQCTKTCKDDDWLEGSSPKKVTPVVKDECECENPKMRSPPLSPKMPVQRVVRPEIFALPEGKELDEHIAHLRTIRSERTSLILRMWVVKGDGSKVSLDALVDTGCEVNLIRAGLVPPDNFTPAPCRIRLVTANGSSLGGGDQQVKLRVVAQGYEVTDITPPPTKFLGFQTTFFEADISVDIILSYKWLYEFDIDVFPRKYGLRTNTQPAYFCRDWLIKTVRRVCIAS